MMKLKHISKPFCEGFADGFASPSLAVFGRAAPYKRGSGNLVEESWRQVGEQLQNAMNIEGHIVEQSAAKSKRKARHDRGGYKHRSAGA